MLGRQVLKGMLVALPAVLASGCGQVSTVNGIDGVEAAANPGSENGNAQVPDDAEGKIRFGTTDTLKITVGLLTTRGGRCSGVLIAPNVVMTADHCVVGVPPSDVSFARAGTTVDLYFAAEVQRFFPTDLAMVRLNRNVTGITFANASKIWGALPSDELQRDARLTVYGFGLNENEASPNARQSAVIPFAGTTTRSNAPGYENNAAIIATNGGRGQGICGGDSGGGVFYKNHLLGINHGADTRNGCRNGTQSLSVPPYVAKAKVANIYRQWTGRALAFIEPAALGVQQPAPTPTVQMAFRKLTCRPPQMLTQTAPYRVQIRALKYEEGCSYSQTVPDAYGRLLTSTISLHESAAIGGVLDLSVPAFIPGTDGRGAVEVVPVGDSGTRCTVMGALRVIDVANNGSTSPVQCTLE